jgi:putative glutathione S-transferase
VKGLARGLLPAEGGVSPHKASETGRAGAEQTEETMGLLIDGVWQNREDDRSKSGGRYERPSAAFRNWVTPDGRPGPTGHDGFAAARGRYHLYVSLACPWAHRTLIMRVLKGLEEVVSVSVTHWLMAEQGWTFTPAEGVIPDPLFNSRYLHEIYARADPQYTGRASVPVLWDRHTQAIVNNESAEIIRMFNSAFDGVGAAAGDYYPSDLRAEIDEINARVYATVNNGVYRAGFATAQAAYEEAFRALFETLDWLEARLQGQRFLLGDRLTEADWRLFTTLVRFDAVYFGHFKCNLREIRNYPGLSRYLRELYHWPKVAETVDFFHIKHHYYESHRRINPTGIVPLGPEIRL